MKKLPVLLLTLCLGLSLAACAAPPEPLTPAVMTLKGPTGVGMAKMIEDAAENGGYEFTLAGGPDEVVAGFTGGNIDIAAMPSNLAAKLYAKTNGDIIVLAINNYGNLYILQNQNSGEAVDSLSDLAGKTVYATGQGANPQYILEYLLAEAGLTMGEDVQVEYKSEHAELAALLAAGEADIAMLPEPFVSTAMLKNPDIVQRLDFNELWQEYNGGRLTMSCVAARREFVQENPEAVADFLAALEDSTRAAQSDTAATAQLCAKHEIIPNQAVAEQAIPRCGLAFISGAAMEPALADYFAVLLAADPASIGGAKPGSDLYYIAE